MKPSVIIKGLGAYAPERSVSNADLSQWIETSDEWIFSRTGIRHRRIAREDENTSDMAVEAAKRALEMARLDPSEIDLIVVGTMTPDKPCPSTAAIVQAKLGLRPVAAFDLYAACSGFAYGLEVCSQMLRSGAYRNALFIGAEKISSILDWQDRKTCVLFGDAAGAVVLSPSEKEGVGLLGSILGCDGRHQELLHIPAGGTDRPCSLEAIEARDHYLKMNGQEVFKHAVRVMEGLAHEILDKHHVSMEQIDWIIPHQANIRIIESLANRLGVSMDRFPLNLEHYGNTSAASIPLTLTQAHEEGKIKQGDLILFIAFGAGLSWGANIFRWDLDLVSPST